MYLPTSATSTSCVGLVHPPQQVVPVGPVDVAERQAEPTHDVGVEPFGVQHLRDVVDARRVDRGDDRLLVDVAHQADLALHVAAGSAGRRGSTMASGWMPILAQRRHRVLRRLGLQLARRPDVRQQRDVEEEDVVAADLVPHLADGLEERQRLDVADRAADLGDDDVDVRAAHAPNPRLDLVGDVRDHLHGVAEVLAAALLGDHGRVDLARGDVGRAVQIGVEEALVVADVEVGLGAVVGDEDLAVLERVHRSGVDVEVGVELLHRDPQAARLQQVAEARRGEALAERGGDAAGDENVPGLVRRCQRGSRGLMSGRNSVRQSNGRRPSDARVRPVSRAPRALRVTGSAVAGWTPSSACRTRRTSRSPSWSPAGRRGRRAPGSQCRSRSRRRRPPRR